MTDRRAFIAGLATAPFAASVVPAIGATDIGWDLAVHEFHAAAAVTSALPEDASENMYDAVTTIHLNKLRAVKAYPITTIAMLREKIDLLVAEYGIDDMGSGDEFEHIYADVQRLTGGAA